MRRIRGTFRRVKPFTTTVMAGLLIGYVVATIATILIGQSRLFGSSGESPEARAFVLAAVAGDTEAMQALAPPGSLADRALALKQSRTNGSSAIVDSLTYLGGGAQGPLRVHVYVLRVHLADGTEQLWPMSLTVLGGRVVRIR